MIAAVSDGKTEGNDPETRTGCGLLDIIMPKLDGLGVQKASPVRET